ncbi:MAG TPA: FAD-dependent monooxygenase [Alphaproteobacteria bacterium]
MHEIVILGDGLTGLTMALALAQNGQACALVGPHVDQKITLKNNIDGRTTAIMQDGIVFLQQLGVWKNLEKHSAPLRRMHLISADQDIAFPSDEIGLPQFGFNIPNVLLKDVLLGALQKHGLVTLVAGTIDQIVFPTEESPLHVVLLTGKPQIKLQAKLVIAADGARSKAREAAGIIVSQHDPDQAALVGLVQADETHADTSTEFYYSGGPFTLVPTIDPLQMALVYCDTPDNLDTIKSLDEDELNAHLTEMSQNRFGDLRMISPVQSWPIRPLRAESLVAPHLALIGEAAHVMPPLAAQGFNTSLRDIQALLSVLLQTQKRGLDIAHLSHLRPYEDQRRQDIHLRSRTVNGLNIFIRRDDQIGRRLHAAGFMALDKITPLKKLLMKFALAPRIKAVA